MKRIIRILSLLMFMLILTGCSEWFNNDPGYADVVFYNGDEVLNVVRYELGEKVDLDDILVPEGFEIGYLIDRQNNEVFDLETIINDSYELTVIWAIDDITEYTVKFYNGANLINEVTYQEGDLITLADIEYQGDLEIDYLIYSTTSARFDLNTRINSNLSLHIIFKEVEVEKYAVTFYNEDLELINNVLIEDGSQIKRSDIDLADNYEVLYYLDFEDESRYELNLIVEKELKLIVVYNYLEPVNHEFSIFYLNDTHGAVLNKGSELGLAKIGNYIEKERDDNSLFIAGGDMFQGQLISNDNKGSIFIEVFNHLNMDAFVIGNHEFDWGLDEIMKYFNDQTNPIKANFPILGANVKLKETRERPDYIDAHTIVNKNGVKIGIIGVIGDGLESSIATYRIQDYYFSDAYQAVVESVNEIKNEVDFILVVNHHTDHNFNEKVAKLDKVSSIFNGHFHQTYIGYTSGVPYIQSGANGEKVGRVDLEFLQEGQTFTMTNSDARNISSHQHLNSQDNVIKEIVDRYYSELAHLYEETILISSRAYSQSDLAYYIAKIMAKSSGAVLGVQNSGGTRSTINNNQQIKAADLFQVFPFDNLIIKADIKGSTLKSFYYNNSYTYLEIDLSSINDNDYYTIATNDYVFYGSYNQKNFFYDARNVEEVADMYEKFYETLYLLKASGKTHFNTNDPIDFWG